MVYMCFKALVGNVLEPLTLSILLLLNIFKLSMRLEQLLDSLNSQCYNEVQTLSGYLFKKKNHQNPNKIIPLIRSCWKW